MAETAKKIDQVMPAKRYQIIFRGKIAKGHDLEEVKRNLASLFKIEDGKIEQLFSGKKIVIKDNADYESVMKYKMAFETAGAICKVKEVPAGPRMELSSEEKNIKPSQLTHPEMMTCPRCDFEQEAAEECIKCGIIINKYSKENRDTPKETPQAALRNTKPLYFPVSKLKLVLMSLCTFGLYEYYWFYQNWKFIKYRTGQQLRPFWRAFFSIFFCYQLFKHIRNSADSNGCKSNIKPGWFFLGYLALSATWQLPDPFGLISLLTFLPLLHVQGAINDVNVKAAPGADRNSNFSINNIIVMIIGGILLTLVALGMFIPPSFYAENEQNAWEEFTSVEGNFTVSFPGKPQKTTQNFNTQDGKINQQRFIVEQQGGRVAYMISHSDYPKGRGKIVNADQILDSVRDFLVGEHNGKVTNETTILLDAYPGREFHFEGTWKDWGLSGHVRIFLVEQRLYRLMAFGLDAEVDKKDVDRFFLSFKRLRSKPHGSNYI